MLRVGRGHPLPFGCSEAPGGGLNFSLLSPCSSSAWLSFVAPRGLKTEARLLELCPSQNRTGGVWHVKVMTNFPTKGLRYVWFIDPPLGPDGRPSPKALPVLDNCARALDTGYAASWNLRTGGKFSPLAVVPDFRAQWAFNWDGVKAPEHELQDLIIYEAHVRSFTKHPDSGVVPELAGTFLGLVQKIPHLKRLGINAIELLPIFEFDETACPRKHPSTGEDLCNYWGYSTTAFYCPMQRLAAGTSDEVGAAIIQFKTMVRELHRHGIEVILDVVFNHTGEGAWGDSNWHSLSQIAESQYYLLSNGFHTNYTGCGNTVNANHPTCTEWLMDCLRYWALEMKVDGFRFDLASSLTRGQDGQCMPDPPFIRRLASDPTMKHVKMIAEPWDCAWPDGYLVGKFPSCGEPRFAEWNGKFRDTVRQFIKGDEGLKGSFATRICGSSDLYQEDGRGPCHSINFITAHDGFTLRDLVSYNKKHNHANAEESGEDNNISWNCGQPSDDGPTRKAEVEALRQRQMRNFMVALMLSAGTPMVTAGDEYGRTQQGNNNTWCQDELNWFSWSECAREEEGFLRFCRLLISLRKHLGDLLCRKSFFSDEVITWNHSDWEDPYNYLSFILHSREEAPATGDCSPSDYVPSAGDPYSPVGDDTRSESLSELPSESAERGSKLLVAFNAGYQAWTCELPQGYKWHRLIDTSLTSPQDFAPSDEDAQLIGGGGYLMTPYSCIVLRHYKDPADAQIYDDDIDIVQDDKLADELLRVVTSKMQDLLLGPDDYTATADDDVILAPGDLSPTALGA